MGRRIQLVALNASEADLRTACGLRVWDSEGTRVLYRPRSTPHQTEYALLHELAHVWLGHDSDVLIDDATRSSGDAAEIIRWGQAVRARVRYTSADEHEAELTACLLQQRLHRGRPAGDDPLSRLESTLSHPLAPPCGSRLGEAA
ncbi:ImmA/IrrE family metallo-endopeptidase [Streptomyces sp. 7G]|nr:ImmA/IrrE family metallo-endopeptidase [Streptomyces sp. 7G]